ncbi:MAG TPA: HAD family hydrolase [Nitrospirota bacterium]|nr:HAD family hydrolase [Nitrospirota bacterium]
MGNGGTRQAMSKAVFLDRDGTVNEEVGYLRDLAHLRLIPGAGLAVRRLNETGFAVILVTNQSGVARGYFPESLVHDAHSRLDELLKLDGARIDAVYYCPHHPTAGNSSYTVECDCRKPRTGLIDRAVRDLSIDRARSCMVGDKWSDVELAQRAGLCSILVMSGFAPDDPGNERPDRVKDPDFIARSLLEAADWIISRDRHAPGRGEKG